MFCIITLKNPALTRFPDISCYSSYQNNSDARSQETNNRHENCALRSINQLFQETNFKQISYLKSVRSIPFFFYSVRSTHIYFRSDSNCVRPTHFFIVRILSENEINNFMAPLSRLLFKRITFKTNFQLLQ